MEQQLKTRAYPHIAIARPGMLSGDRKNFRIGEFVGGLVTNFMPGDYKTIKAIDVAAALISEANSGRSGAHYLASSEMQGASNR